MEKELLIKELKAKISFVINMKGGGPSIASSILGEDIKFVRKNDFDYLVLFTSQGTEEFKVIDIESIE